MFIGWILTPNFLDIFWAAKCMRTSFPMWFVGLMLGSVEITTGRAFSHGILASGHKHSLEVKRHGKLK